VVEPICLDPVASSPPGPVEVVGLGLGAAGRPKGEEAFDFGDDERAQARIGGWLFVWAGRIGVGARDRAVLQVRRRPPTHNDEGRASRSLPRKMMILGLLPVNDQVLSPPRRPRSLSSAAVTSAASGNVG
jgi:hypothetical protein